VNRTNEATLRTRGKRMYELERTLNLDSDPHNLPSECDLCQRRLAHIKTATAPRTLKLEWVSLQSLAHKEELHHTTLCTACNRPFTRVNYRSLSQRTTFEGHCFWCLLGPSTQKEKK